MARTPRWEYVTRAISGAGISNFSRIPAFDGRHLRKLSLESMRSVEWLFRRNHFKNDPRVIGCALSHIKAWLLAVSCLDDGQVRRIIIASESAILGELKLRWKWRVSSFH